MLLLLLKSKKEKEKNKKRGEKQCITLIDGRSVKGYIYLLETSIENSLSERAVIAASTYDTQIDTQFHRYTYLFFRRLKERQKRDNKKVSWYYVLCHFVCGEFWKKMFFSEAHLDAIFVKEKKTRNRMIITCGSLIILNWFPEGLVQPFKPRLLMQYKFSP